MPEETQPVGSQKAELAAPKQTKPAKFMVDHDRPNCIGCAACAAIFPEKWEMKDDSKSSIIGAITNEQGWENIDFGDDTYEKHKEAADSCPVNVIHIVKKETGERVI